MSCKYRLHNQKIAMQSRVCLKSVRVPDSRHRRIWVPSLKHTCTLVNIQKTASKDPDLKSWFKFKFWSWSGTKNTHLKKIFSPRKMKLWENYTMANKKTCKHYLNNYCYTFSNRHQHQKKILVWTELETTILLSILTFGDTDLAGKKT